jgi:hypothetical protein
MRLKSNEISKPEVDSLNEEQKKEFLKLFVQKKRSRSESNKKEKKKKDKKNKKEKKEKKIKKHKKHRSDSRSNSETIRRRQKPRSRSNSSH